MLLTMEGISKSFPGVQALKDVNFSVDHGEVHALIGENGAGKSTLMKILGGVHSSDAGHIKLKDKVVHMKSPAQAGALGVAVVHQEFSLMLDMPVMENIFIGRFPLKKGGFIDYGQLRSQATEILERIGEVSLDARVRDLTIAEMQLVEIARALSYNPEVLVMDEPTAALNEQEIGRLFTIIKRLKEQGVAIIYISHRLDEVFQIAKHCTVMRDGKVVGRRECAKTTKEEIIHLMVGRSLNQLFPKVSASSEQVLYEVKHLSAAGRLFDVSFEVHKGEVLGVAGLMGAGQTDLARALFGVLPIDTGEFWLQNEPIKVSNPKQAIAHGIGWVTENRKEEGLVLAQSVMANISLASLQSVVGKGGWFSSARELFLADKYISSLGVKTPSSRQLVSNLSGGNQQKVVLAKWLATAPDVIIMNEPTRGVDVGAKVEIYQIINELAAQGKSIIMFSSELPELLGMTDRILVMSQGRITADLITSDTSQEEIMLYATGGKSHDERIIS